MTTAISNNLPNPVGINTQKSNASKNTTDSQNDSQLNSTKSNDVDLTNGARNIAKFHQAITDASDIDMEKVNAAIDKIKNKTLGIIADSKERIKSSEDIANKLLNSELDLL